MLWSTLMTRDGWVIAPARLESPSDPVETRGMAILERDSTDAPKPRVPLYVGGHRVAAAATGAVSLRITRWSLPGRRFCPIAIIVQPLCLRRHSSGPVEVLDSFCSFGNTDDDPAIVPPLLVYADLRALVDPAGRKEHALRRSRPCCVQDRAAAAESTVRRHRAVALGRLKTGGL